MATLIYNWLRERTAPVAKTHVMRRFHLDASRAGRYLHTMERAGKAVQTFSRDGAIGVYYWMAAPDDAPPPVEARPQGADFREIVVLPAGATVFISDEAMARARACELLPLVRL